MLLFFPSDFDLPLPFPFAISIYRLVQSSYLLKLDYLVLVQISNYVHCVSNYDAICK